MWKLDEAIGQEDALLGRLGGGDYHYKCVTLYEPLCLDFCL